MKHDIIINVRSPHLSLSLFDELDLVHHITLDQDLYRWIMRHIVALIYTRNVFCVPSYIAIGTSHFNLLIKE